MRLLTCLVLGLAAPALAEQAWAVQVGEAATLAAARKSSAVLARKLSLAERSSVDGQPPTVPIAGAGVQIHRAEKGYRLLAYVGRAAQAQIALELIRREIHSATLTVHEVEAGALDLPDSDLVPAWVLVSGRDRSHPGAVEQARSASKRLGLPWDSRGLVWDSADGLIFPRAYDERDDNPFPSLFAGGYFLRRTDGCDAVQQTCVSVERAEAYDGGQPGELWVVVGLAFDATEGRERLAALREVMPQITAEPTWVWMGCPF